MKAIICLVLLSLIASASCATPSNLANTPGNLFLSEDFFNGEVVLCFADSNGDFTGTVSNVGFISDGTFDGQTFSGTIEYGGVQVDSLNGDFTANVATFTMKYDANGPLVAIGTFTAADGSQNTWTWSIHSVNRGLRFACELPTAQTPNLIGHYESRVFSEDGLTYTVVEVADFCEYDSRNHPGQIQGSISTQHGHKWYVQGILSDDESTLWANIWRADDLSGNLVTGSAIYEGISFFTLVSEEDLYGVMTVTQDGSSNGRQSEITLKRHLTTGNNPQYPTSSSSACKANSGLVDGKFTPKLYDYDFNTFTLNRKTYLKDQLPQ